MCVCNPLVFAEACIHLYMHACMHMCVRALARTRVCKKATSLDTRMQRTYTYTHAHTLMQLQKKLHVLTQERGQVKLLSSQLSARSVLTNTQNLFKQHTLTMTFLKGLIILTFGHLKIHFHQMEHAGKSLAVDNQALYKAAEQLAAKIEKIHKERLQFIG